LECSETKTLTESLYVVYGGMWMGMWPTGKHYTAKTERDKTYGKIHNYKPTKMGKWSQKGRDLIRDYGKAVKQKNKVLDTWGKFVMVEYIYGRNAWNLHTAFWCLSCNSFSFNVNVNISKNKIISLYMDTKRIVFICRIGNEWFF